MNADLAEVIEQCNSDDSVERFEAFEQIWDEILSQGSPGPEAEALIAKLAEWIREGHPDWLDILEGLYGCAVDLADGPTRVGTENSRRLLVLTQLVQEHPTYEAILAGPCSLRQGNCRSHQAAAGLLRISQAHRADWLSAEMLKLIRTKPESHNLLWEIVEEAAAFDALLDEELLACMEQTESESIKRSAVAHLAARGNQQGIAELRGAVNALVLPQFRTTPEEASIVGRNPHGVPLDVLLDLFRRAHDLHAIEDLACSILRKVGEDYRDGWDVVLLRRTEGTLLVRHPEVRPFIGEPSERLIACAGDLRRKSLIVRIDTDIWKLFGLG